MGQKGRIFWGKKPIFPTPQDLIRLTKSSWEWFLQKGLPQVLRSISPVVDYSGKNWELHFGEITYREPTITPKQALEKGLTYAAAVNVDARLINKRTGEETRQTVFLFNLPWMTPEGTFIINGIERAIINQLVRAPGVYFTAEEDPLSGKQLFQAEIRPVRGSWLEFFFSRRGVIYARIDRRRRMPATILLRAVGLETNKELRQRLGRLIEPTLEIDSTTNKEEALLEFYRKLRPGEPAVLETAANFFRERFFDLGNYELGQVGRYKLNKRLKLNFPDNQPAYWVLTPQDLLATVRYLVALAEGKEKKLDDIDHLGNRRLRRVGEIVAQVALQPAMSRFERAIKEKMSLTSTKERGVKPGVMINPQALITSLNSFFKTSQLSTILDQTNPLSELDLLRRVTVIGPGGLSRERASFSIRDIHASQYGRICPIRSPEGPNIGLVTYLALFAKVDKYGFLQTPYRLVKKIKVDGQTKMKVTDKVIYLSADEEENFYITHAGVAIDANGFIKDRWVPARYQGEFIEVPVEKIQLIDFVPQQIVGTSASLIPFVAHDETNRALMGSHMQCQAVPLIETEAPIVGTGMETVVPEAMHRVVRAEEAGKVTWVDGEKIVVENKKKQKRIYHLTKFKRTNPNGTCYNQRPVVQVGQWVGKGDLLADGPATKNGELALGRNLLIAYCSWEGLTYEDAIVISDRLVKEDVLTSIHLEEYEAKVVETKLGPEEVTRDIPNVGEAELAKLTPEGIVMIGAEVGPHDILVGKVQPKGEKELTAEERLLRAIFGEKAREVKDTSLRVPHGEGGVVIDVKVLDRDAGDELEPGTLKVIKVTVAQLRRIKEGDKLAGRHGNKGVISRIVPVEDMPFLADGTPIDIIISPLSVIARMNLGQILEGHLGWAAEKLGQKWAVPAFEKLPEEVIRQLLDKAGLPVDGKVVLYDGKTGEPYEQKVMVGRAYIMKLVHMVEDKAYARSTGPYSLVTQQPLGGKARMGGQRLGEMEVWALEAHRAAYTLQEMLTTKSDDVAGRTKAFRAIIQGQQPPPPTLPESFKVLVKELAGLGLAVKPEGKIEGESKQEEEE